MAVEEEEIVALDKIEPKILMVRGQKVLIDADLAVLYGTTTKKLNQAVKRNRNRFPPDFMFQVSAEEKQEVVTICDHLSMLRFSPTLPFVFTEHGAVMAASVLNTARAVEVSVFVVRAFVKLRHMLGPYREVTRRLDEHDRKLVEHDRAIRFLLAPSEKPRKRIGFQKEPADGSSPKAIRKTPTFRPRKT